LSVLLSFGHCVVCSSVFWPLCCLFFCLLAIVLSVLRFTDSDYLFGIFKLFWHKTLIFCIMYDQHNLYLTNGVLCSCTKWFKISQFVIVMTNLRHINFV
jgi:hypothetical protein